ncbi:carbon-nitrogen hydrolase family protein [Acinetobacter sp. ME22]|uniref:carbon-nitrogen hydrolase family protein n=1 Tax=Acinetobacter sp. ME22 TaxID=2904802 RepID=UPI001EDA989F|nr:carbon-nitrogen hydrolase family protein [Acinetobacter sp. ME22]MCG2572458.1 carbon-nitrogen hydrolase family protein [Acinetobacter sp. ME22]
MSNSLFGIAGVQMQVSAFASNVEQMGNYMRYIRMRYPWVKMVMFSELAPLGPKHSTAEVFPSQTEIQLTELARETGLWLISGSMFERVEGADESSKVYNTLSVINPEGYIVTRYRKLFPFRPYEKNIEAGTEFCVFDVPDVGRFGVSICYDMWFPETTRTLVAMGAEVILHPTMTDTIDRDIELAIARASAAQNQVYFIDINGVGDGGVGKSIVVDPSGYVLHQSESSAEIIPIEVDLERVRRERRRGLRTLGQPLKSFRDRDCNFTVYQKENPEFSYLDSLGPLTKPE